MQFITWFSSVSSPLKQYWPFTMIHSTTEDHAHSDTNTCTAHSTSSGRIFAFLLFTFLKRIKFVYLLKVLWINKMSGDVPVIFGKDVCEQNWETESAKEKNVLLSIPFLVVMAIYHSPYFMQICIVMLMLKLLMPFLFCWLALAGASSQWKFPLAL